MIYLDYAATTPMSEKAAEAFLHTSKVYFHNTESLHDDGQRAKELLEHARTSFANRLKKDAGGIYFTGGGSDGNFLAITSLAFGSMHKGKHIITSNVEHPSVDQTLHFLEKNGYTVTRIPIDQDSGKITLEEVKKHIQSDTILATIQHINSETGIVQDIGKLGSFFSEKQILFHSDCVQSFTKFDLNIFNSFPLDAFTVSAHKIYGPKGTGAVYISPKVPISPLLSHVTHERGFKPGTIDLPSIIAFVTACDEALNDQSSHYNHVVEMRKLFISLILNKKDIIFENIPNGSPYILPIRLKGLEGQFVMQELNRRQLAVSTGSACKIGQQSPSKTLLALGKTESEAYGLVRISLSHLTKLEEIHMLGEALESISNKFLSVREESLK
ncbi:IscS subfamily cysteine desulfurase [Fictibacillus nanhaiensis]|uniref:IscS subfamily cysteine desulfurase n=1 Tax=Fictibacillus nanhaiensis TaxID=742169 RepID=UPI001C98889F|nr:IscS subfamily cysteine desulfurase [Fictibacillus nanhaiensis]MBY6035329.1 IscS subfamily cysteine desulfurase [Fictibacillus nanhaiensis]